MVEKWMNLRMGYCFNCSSVFSSGDHVIIERARFLARHRFLFKIVVIRVADNVNNFVERHVAQAIKIRERFDGNVPVSSRRRRTSH